MRTNYYDDPSEAFAESYADMQYPGVDFIYTDLLKPDQDAFDAIRADVLNPWRGPRTVILRGSSSQSFKLRTPLDGTASFDLTAPAGAAYRLRVLAASRALRAAANGYTICGARSLTVQVRRVAGRGSFRLAASLP